MKHIPTFAAVLSLTLLAATVSDVMAQDGRRGGGRQRGGFGGPGGGDPMLVLLQIEKVQQEIGLQDDQKEALTKVAEEARNAGRPTERIDFRNASDQERQEFFAKMQKSREAAMKKTREQLDEVLLPDQLKRLQEISIQVQGAEALDNDRVTKELNVSEEQKEKIAKVREDVQDEMRSKMRELFQSDNRDGIRSAFETMRKDAETKVLAVLTQEQRQKFEEMKGTAFEMPEQADRGGRGFGDRGRGGDRRRGGDRDDDRRGDRNDNRSGNDRN